MTTANGQMRTGRVVGTGNPSTALRAGLERETGNGKTQPGLPLKCGRCVSSKRASQLLSNALGHGYSRPTVVRLVESGQLRGHRLPPRGHIWIETDSVLELIQSVLTDPPA